MRLHGGAATKVKAWAISCDRMYDSLRGLNLEEMLPGESRYLIGYDYEWEGIRYFGEHVSPLPYAGDERFTIEIIPSSPEVSWLAKEQKSAVRVTLKWLLFALVAGLTIYLARHFDLQE